MPRCLKAPSPFEEGKQAYQQQVSFFDNPYFGLVEEQMQWANGWGAGQHEKWLANQAAATS